MRAGREPAPCESQAEPFILPAAISVTAADASGSAVVSGKTTYWNTGSASLNVGYFGNGTLTISDGGHVSGALQPQSNTYIGCKASAAGNVSVVGLKSQLNAGRDIYVGYLGCGTLSINSGGKALARSTYVGWDAGANGLLDFGSGGGTLSTKTLFVSPQQLTGTGNIITNGIVSDFDLVFDADAYNKPDFPISECNGNCHC